MSNNETIEKQKTQAEKEQAERIEQIHKLAEQSRPLSMDEVAVAFIAGCRVEDWENLGDTFGGRKIGAIYSYIMEVLNGRIEDFNSEVITADVPLCHQNPGVISCLTIEIPGGCKCQK